MLDVTVPAGGAHRHGPALDVTVLRAEVLRTIREVFADPQDVVTSVGAGRFAVLHRVPRAYPV